MMTTPPAISPTKRAVTSIRPRLSFSVANKQLLLVCKHTKHKPQTRKEKEFIFGRKTHKFDVYTVKQNALNIHKATVKNDMYVKCMWRNESFKALKRQNFLYLELMFFLNQF